jgi:hypothetical protein
LLLEAFRHLVNNACCCGVLMYVIIERSVLRALCLRYAAINASLLLMCSAALLYASLLLLNSRACLIRLMV